MRIRKVSCFVIVLTLVLFSPPLDLAEPQEEQVSATEGVNVSEGLLSGILTVFNVPSRALLCGLSAGWGVIVMGLSMGRGYDLAANDMKASCAGPWVITPQTVREGILKGDKKSSGD
jgi:hypothetical protein